MLNDTYVPAVPMYLVDHLQVIKWLITKLFRNAVLLNTA